MSLKIEKTVFIIGCPRISLHPEFSFPSQYIKYTLLLSSISAFIKNL